MKIYKYQITEKITTHQMPYGADILAVQMQRGVPTIWVRVNESDEIGLRTFRIVGTGEEIPGSNFFYIGTVQEADGMLVWHIFEEIK